MSGLFPSTTFSPSHSNGAIHWSHNANANANPNQWQQTHMLGVATPLLVLSCPTSQPLLRPLKLPILTALRPPTPWPASGCILHKDRSGVLTGTMSAYCRNNTRWADPSNSPPSGPLSPRDATAPVPVESTSSLKSSHPPENRAPHVDEIDIDWNLLPAWALNAAVNPKQKQGWCEEIDDQDRAPDVSPSPIREPNWSGGDPVECRDNEDDSLGETTNNCLDAGEIPICSSNLVCPIETQMLVTPVDHIPKIRQFQSPSGAVDPRRPPPADCSGQHPLNASGSVDSEGWTGSSGPFLGERGARCYVDNRHSDDVGVAKDNNLTVSAAPVSPVTLLRKKDPEKAQVVDGKPVFAYWCDESTLVFRVLYSDGSTSVLQHTDLTEQANLYQQETGSVPDDDISKDAFNVSCVMRMPQLPPPANPQPSIAFYMWFCRKPTCTYKSGARGFTLQCGRCRTKCCPIPMLRGTPRMRVLNLLAEDTNYALDRSNLDLPDDREWVHVQSLHDQFTNWEEPPKKKGRKRKKTVQLPYHPRQAGLLPKPYPNTWNCNLCTVAIPVSNLSAAPGLCTQCSPSHLRGTLRAAKLVGRGRMAQQLQQDRILAAEHPESFEEEDMDSEPEDKKDGAYNQADEKRVNRYRQISKNGVYETEYMNQMRKTREFTSKIQALDDSPKSIQAASRWSLVTVPPKNFLMSPYTFLATFSLSKPFIWRQLAGRTTIMNRNIAQAYLVRCFHTTLHWSLGPLGTTHFMHYLTHKAYHPCERLASNQNHPYDKKRPYRPVVLNHERPERPVLTHFDTIIREFLPKIVGDIRRFGTEKDRRGVKPHLVCGYTAEDAKAWQRNPGLGTCAPAIVGVENSSRYGPSTLQFFLRVGQLVSEDVWEELVGGTELDMHPHESRRMWARKFALKLGSTRERAMRFRVEHMTLAIGHLVESHVDAPNCTREHMDWLIGVSTILDLTRLGCDDLISLVEHAELDPTCVPVAVLFTTRSICGAHSKIDSRADPAVQAMLHRFTLLSNCNEMQKFADVDALGFESLRRELRTQMKQRVGAKTKYCGRDVTRVEGNSRSFYLSSYEHMTWRLMEKYPELFTYRALVELYTFIGIECNGQIMYWEIVSKWIEGDYCDTRMDGTANAFLGAWSLHSDLYLMASREASHIFDDNGNNWVSSPENRFRTCGPLRIFTPGTSPSNGRPLQWVREVEEVLHSVRQMDRKCTTDMERGGRAYSLFMGISGINHLTGQNLVQLAGRFGLLDHGCAFFAAIAPTGEYGPTKFIEDAHNKQKSVNPDHVKAKKEDYAGIFQCMVDTLRRAGFKDTEPMAVEQVGCAGSRQQRNCLKKEFVFEDPSTDRIQLLLHPIRDKKGETSHCYYDFDSGIWSNFFDATGMIPVFRMFERAEFDNFTQEQRLLTKLQCFNDSGLHLPTMPFSEKIPTGCHSVLL